MHRYTVKFGGESGQGINTLGHLLSKSIKNSGYRTFAYREYPSLIRGGVASYQIDFSNKEINSSSRYCNILAIFDEDSLHEYLTSLNKNGILIYDDKDISFTQEEDQYITDLNIHKIYLDTKQIATQSGGTEIMSNVVMLGFIWKILDLDISILESEVKEYFTDKEVDLEKETQALKGGYNSPTFREEYKQEIPPKGNSKSKTKIIGGNESLALGLIAGGLRAYYAYPMTPSTSIFKYLGNTYKETGILVKQAENEITAALMTMGSMAMGTRAAVATSGGGFDLMMETISCSGITETPMVVIVSQRTGAGTGVPTWTGAGDINSTIKGGHGSFPRCVISVSDATDSYTLAQKALNIAEQYQIPVMLMTEKQISESLFNIEDLPKPIKIERSLSEEQNLRYQITEEGISPRYVPDFDKLPYLATSDEHLEDGTSTENSEKIIEMSNKRARKLETLKSNLPEPIYFGKENAETIFVGWGSTKNTMLDIINNKNENIGYLHYEYLYPLKTETLEELISQNKRLVLIENNQTGDFGKLIQEETDYIFKEKLLKYDGRPFFIEDILDFLQ
jgi:2-oxoglutarate ferredoxin oxidoreductase subunit alpha